MDIETSKIRPFAFLFTTPIRGEKVGEPLDKVFLSALKAADPNGLTDTRVYRGGVLLAQLSYKTEAIATKSTSHQRSRRQKTFQEQWTKRSDSALYAMLIGDFVETCLAEWNTIDKNTFSMYVAKNCLDAIFLSSLPVAVGEDMAKRLCTHPHYIGAISPDLGNPLHRYLFIQVMFKDAFIRNGCVFVRAGYEGTYDGYFFGAESFSPDGMVVLPYEEFEENAPSANIPDSLSPRGIITEIRMRQRMELDVHQKIINSLHLERSLRDIERPFQWDLSQLPDSPEEVKVQATKLTDYLLDIHHRTGSSKAKFFREHLEIMKKDWLYLHSQFVDGLGKVPYEDVRLDEYGIRFTAYLPVIGRNGATATIETGWIVRPGERASFVTAMPATKDHILERRAIPPSIVSDDLTGDARWQAIYDLAEKAGKKAMEECITTPIFIEGQVCMDGLCGGAYIVIEDGRRSFARWLRKKGVGNRHYQRGYEVLAHQIGQSAESAEVYAEAFVRVLRRNGIECHAEPYLD